MNFIHLLLSQFFTVIFLIRTSNSLQNYHNFLSWRSDIIVISKRSKGLLAQCALFSLRQLGIFFKVSRFMTPCHKTNAQKTVRNISPIDMPCLYTHVGICHLFIIMKSMTEFSTSCDT